VSSEGRTADPMPRAVVLVGNPAAPYSRGLRIARALVEAGYRVEVAAVAAAGLPDRELDGAVEIRRYHPSGPLRGLAAAHRGMGVATPPGPAARAISADGSAPSSAAPERMTASMSAVPERPARTGAGRLRVVPSRARAVAARLRRRGATVVRWVLWPHTVRGWWHALARELEPADLYHACGSLTVAAALARRSRDRAAGRSSIVVYDAIDDVFEGNNVIGMPGVLRRVHAAREARWAHAADGRVTVNEGLAERLTARWGLAEPPLVIPNYPDVPGSAPVTDLIRAATGLPASTRIVVFQGRLGPRLGIDEAAEAVLQVPDAALVLVGFGRWADRCRARDADPRFAGRHFTLPAVHPDEIVAWTASADVAVVPLPPVSVNQRLSTPNKFWEAIAAGTPVVVGPGLDLMGDLVRGHDLGRVAASLAPEDLAAAIRAMLDEAPAARIARRRRIAALARDQFSWAAAAASYRAFAVSLAEEADRPT
jgi:glycosyltransferase involved in cell wall biosynthesis